VEQYLASLGPPEEITREKAERLFRPEDDPGMAEAGEKALVIAVLLGMDAETDLDLADPAGRLEAETIPYEEAVRLFKGRLSVTKKEWEDLEPKLRFRSFTLAKLETYEAIEKIRQRLVGAIEKDESLVEIWPELKTEGTSPFYWETVYRTSIQTAYNAGRRTQIDKDKPDALELVVIDDQRTSDICRPLYGLVLPYDDPFWQTHWPPFHFNCRTTVRSVYKAQKEEMEKIPGEAERKTLARRFRPQSGFGGNPADSGNYWMMLPGMFNRGLRSGAIHELNFMDNVIADYDAVWKGYKRENFGTGWVDVSDAAGKEKEFPENNAIAKLLAEKEGCRVKQLPQHKRSGWKNPDYLIDGELWDLKSPVSTSARAVARGVEKAEEQAPNVVLHVQDSVNDQNMRTEIREVFVREKFPKAPKSTVEKLIIIRGDSVEQWTAGQIIAGWKK
jgi:SPP1 gp7 family putative phage head morphogenesis protein